jgi:hypothetical protein
VTRRRAEQRPPDGGRRSVAGNVLFAVPIGLVSAVLLWFGDQHLIHRDWAIGAAVFGLGLLGTGLTVRLLRRAGLVR